MALEEVEMIPGRRYLFASNDGGDLVVGTYVGKADGAMLFDDAVGFTTDKPSGHMVGIKDLIAIEPWQQTIDLKNYMVDKSTEVAAKQLRFRD